MTYHKLLYLNIYEKLTFSVIAYCKKQRIYVTNEIYVFIEKILILISKNNQFNKMIINRFLPVNNILTRLSTCQKLYDIDNTIVIIIYNLNIFDIYETNNLLKTITSYTSKY